MGNLAEKWRSSFWQVIARAVHADGLRAAALSGDRTDWTTRMTTVVVETCEAQGWQCSAKGHKLQLLPVPRQEYLSLDAVAFAHKSRQWQFPIAVAELQNEAGDEYTAYCLWKLLCVRADLRLLLTYRPTGEECARLVTCLEKQLVAGLGYQRLTQLPGETVLAVAATDGLDSFPYGYFKWWQYDPHGGHFRAL